MPPTSLHDKRIQLIVLVSALVGVVFSASLISIFAALIVKNQVSPIPIMSSSSSTTSSNPTSVSASLYFEVTCTGCSVRNRSSTLACYPTIFGSWFGKPWYRSEFGGELDYYDARIGIVGMAVFGNGSARYPFTPFQGPFQQLPPNYQGSLPGASFELISCTGTLQAKLMSTNGSVIWQATAYPTALNKTISYIMAP